MTLTTESTPPPFNQLTDLLFEIDDLNKASAVLSWDQSTYMPSGGAAARGRQLATLGRLAHEKFTSAEIGKLLDALQSYQDSLPFDDDKASLLRVTRRQYERATRIPAEFMAKMYQHAAIIYDTWTRARPANDFASVQDLLEKTLDYSRQIANYFPGYEHIADPLIDFADYGMKASTVRALFGQLREALVPLVKAVTEAPPADSSAFQQEYSPAAVTAFAEEVVRRFGYDFQRGRLDATPHPFCTTFAIDDVRITTRYPKRDLSDPIFSVLHESGHAMYEQGVNPAYDGLPLAGGTSAGVHESQSRLWENIVGRSRGFWEYFLPRLQAALPGQLDHTTVEQVYKAANKVQRSLIRTEADELTYNLHVMIRFDLELALLEGTLAVRDLPQAWHARYQSDLGITAPNDTDGVLQDVHWYSWTIGGMFQGYTIGNILSAQFYDKALQAHPSIPSEIQRGEFGTLHDWLRENIYQYGSKYTAPELIERVLGGLSLEPYMHYLRAKYGDLYGLAL